MQVLIYASLNKVYKSKLLVMLAAIESKSGLCFHELDASLNSQVEYALDSDNYRYILNTYKQLTELYYREYQGSLKHLNAMKG